MKELYFITACYLDDIAKDKVIVELLYNGSKFRGTLSEVVK